jgi:hypothetical protein
MSSLPRTRRPHTATRPITGSCRWNLRPVLPTADDLNGLSGLLAVATEDRTTEYLVTPLADRVADGAVLRGWSMTKSDGTVYHLDAAEGLRCDCPDHTFHPERPGGCRHMRALAAALAVLTDGNDPTPPTAPAARPAYRSAGDLAANDPEAFERHLDDVA